ncbi:hypothetical protein ACFWUP_10150 [Nocardia sp. NPDC058658]|uniref:hypothetical protein n=1 Tax=Nocardia sp. NPDC058658 TaxID=3346580 RepID=UPI0036592211
MRGFDIDGHQVTFELGDKGFRVLVDGAVIPVTWELQDHHTTNVRTYEEVLKARHPVDWIPFGHSRKAGEPSIYPERRAAYIRFDIPTTYVYNTAFWASESVWISFAPDFGSAEVTTTKSVDSST